MLSHKNILLVIMFFLLFLFVSAGTFWTLTRTNNKDITFKESSSTNLNQNLDTNEADWDKIVPPIEKKEISLTIAGDTMFDRAVDYNFRAERIYEVISNIKDVFNKTEVSFLNLEGPISATDIPADGTRDSLIFNQPPLVTNVLVDLGINGVSLANNHTNNNGKLGLLNTKKVLTQNSIQAVGEESTFGDYSVGRFVNGTAKLSIITINCLEVKADLAEIISTEKGNGANVVIFPHWGEEYNPIHNLIQEKLAHTWIDEGADMVVGSHPHVVQDAETYMGKPIFYSLGNFIFDQTWSQPTQQGLILKASFVDSNLLIELLPIVSKKYKPELKIDNDREASLKGLFDNFGQDIANGVLKFSL